MPTRSDLGAKVQEGETFLYSTIVKDELGVAIDLTDAAVDATVSYYIKATGATINSRNAQTIITAGVGSNEHTPGADGSLLFKSLVADAPAVAADTPVVLRYTITYDDGAAVERTGIHEAEFVIEDLPTLS